MNGRYEFRHTSAEMRENSMEYIMNQMNMLIPILIAMIILTLMSIISSTVIMIRQNMHNYSIYYMMGFTWKRCVLIHVESVIMMQMGIFLFIHVMYCYLRENWCVRSNGLFFGKIGSCWVVSL